MVYVSAGGLQVIVSDIVIACQTADGADPLDPAPLQCGVMLGEALSIISWRISFHRLADRFLYHPLIC